MHSNPQIDAALAKIREKEMSNEEKRRRAIDCWFKTFGPTYRELLLQQAREESALRKQS